MPETVIATEALTKWYGSDRGIIDVDLEVRAGEVFGFLGPNGAGKSTTIRLLVDMIRPTSGTARIFGLDARRDGSEIRKRIGYLPGDLEFDPARTGREVVEHLDRLRGNGAADRIAELVERLDVDLDRKMEDLSTGNRQKIGLVQAFMHDPMLLILDEPTAGLDPLVQQQVHELIAAASQRGATVFLSSHVLPEVERVADRVGIIREGKLLEVASVDDLRSRAVRMVDITFATEPVPAAELQAIPGVDELLVSGTSVRLTYAGAIDPLLAVISTRSVVDLQIRHADLERIFLAMYEGRRL